MALHCKLILVVPHDVALLLLILPLPPSSIFPAGDVECDSTASARALLAAPVFRPQFGARICRERSFPLRISRLAKQ